MLPPHEWCVSLLQSELTSMCIAEVWIAFLMARRCLGLGFVFSEYGVSWNILNSMRLLEQDDFNRPDKWDRSIQNDVRCRWDFWIETVCTIFSGKFRKFIGSVQVSQPLCTHFFHKSCLEGWACSSGADQSKKKDKQMEPEKVLLLFAL